MNLENIKIIGFDLDQTLYPKSPEIDNAIQKYIYVKISEFKKSSLKEAEKLFIKYYSVLQSGTRSLIEIGFNENIAGNIVQEALENADLTDFLKPNNKLIDLLNKLKAKYTLDIITGSNKENALKKLKSMNISSNLFNNIITNENSKSNGDAYRLWLSKYPEYNPKNFVYVGDRQKTDIDVPQSLEIKGILVYVKELDDTLGFIQVKDVLDIEKYLL